MVGIETGRNKRINGQTWCGLALTCDRCIGFQDSETSSDAEMVEQGRLPRGGNCASFLCLTYVEHGLAGEAPLQQALPLPGNLRPRRLGSDTRAQRPVGDHPREARRPLAMGLCLTS